MSPKKLLRPALGLIFFTLCISISFVCGKEKHDYDRNQKIELEVDKIGPYLNPSETYTYDSLPFCKSEKMGQEFAESFDGTRKRHTDHDIRFQVETATQKLCTVKLNEAQLKQFKDAIVENFYVFMTIDGFPVDYAVGFVEKISDVEHVYLNSHTHFALSYNKNNLVDATVITSPEHRVKIILNDDSKGESGEEETDKKASITFTYSVSWEESSVAFEDRMEKFTNLSPEGVEVQWFSILNAFLLVLLLTFFLTLMLIRILNKDYQRYTAVTDIEVHQQHEEEYGWKLLHGDVFRFPKHINLLSSILGSGAQLLTLSFSMLTLAVLGVHFEYSKGTVITSAIIIYALTAGIAGYVSGSYYKQLGGTKWIKNVMLTLSIFALPVFLVWAFLNTVALAYSSSAALPFTTIAGLLAIYVCVTFPLTLLGAITGKNYTQAFDAPCRVKLSKREIPTFPWYRSTLVQSLAAGFLPFSAVYVELYYLFSTMWGHKLYTTYAILFLVFLILVIVTACITIALTYLQLSSENHHWWWPAVFNGGMTSLFIFAYCLYFLVYDTGMFGFLQISFYLGYMLLVCYAFFLMLGAVGFLSSLTFVRKIYRAIKCD